MRIVFNSELTPTEVAFKEDDSNTTVFEMEFASPLELFEKKFYTYCFDIYNEAFAKGPAVPELRDEEINDVMVMVRLWFDRATADPKWYLELQSASHFGPVLKMFLLTWLTSTRIELDAQAEALRAKGHNLDELNLPNDLTFVRGLGKVK